MRPPTPRWPKALLLLNLFQHCFAQELVQSHCSNQNTGSSNALVVNDYDSLGSCQTVCEDDYAFAILQGLNCWCSNYVPSNLQAVSNCNQPCPGYPYEFCGSTTKNLFGYLALTKSPSGTLTATTKTSTTAAVATSAAAATTPATTIVIVSTAISSVAVVSTKAIVTTVVQSASSQAVTIFQTETATQQVTVIAASSTTLALSTSTIPTTSSIPTSSSSPTSTHEPTTFISRVTVSGAVVTQVITATPSSTGAATANTLHQTSHGLSAGASAGIAIGVILGLALIGALLFFCCWRPRRRDDNPEGGLDRNTSVLSKAGLLRHMSDRDGKKAPPKLNTAGLAGTGTENPMSAATMATMSTMPSSRAVFVDQRLNPNAWALDHPNTSQTSVGTLQDNRDYSRPLEVRNPDAHGP